MDLALSQQRQLKVGLIVTIRRRTSKPNKETEAPVAAMSSEETQSAEILRPFLDMLQSSDSDIVLDEDSSLRAGRNMSSRTLLLDKVPSVLEALLVTADDDSEEEDNW